ncbi:hypothetical protein [Sphingomonas glacialis]|uniref:hypothetical protein n=1 Tax=Sphingomonas glacialis TaxID=658225 RepID=UPI00112C86B0|nr:hypothetical protein [Sphingomonas glacialis]
MRTVRPVFGGNTDGSATCENRCAIIAIYQCSRLSSGANLRSFYENRAETTSRFYAAQAYLDNRMTIRSMTDLALRGSRVPQAAPFAAAARGL